MLVVVGIRNRVMLMKRDAHEGAVKGRCIANVIASRVDASVFMV